MLFRGTADIVKCSMHGLANVHFNQSNETVQRPQDGRLEPDRFVLGVTECYPKTNRDLLCLPNKDSSCWDFLTYI